MRSKDELIEEFEFLKTRIEQLWNEWKDVPEDSEMGSSWYDQMDQYNQKIELLKLEVQIRNSN